MASVNSGKLLAFALKDASAGSGFTSLVAAPSDLLFSPSYAFPTPGGEWKQLRAAPSRMAFAQKENVGGVNKYPVDRNAVRVVMRILDVPSIIICRDEGDVLFEFFVRRVMKVENLSHVVSCSLDAMSGVYLVNSPGGNKVKPTNRHGDRSPQYCNAQSSNKEKLLHLRISGKP
ncbi:hypothetical protein ACLOJK_006472 [Asimina triloba]